jgi:ubiquinone biosynthesis protein
MVEIVQTLSHVTEREMDLRLEAAAISEFADNIKDDIGFAVPTIDWQRTGRDCLTVSWVDGVALTDKAGIDALGIDKKLLATHVMQHFLRHAMRDGFFHADMHQGNLFVNRVGGLIAVDFGIVSRLSKRESRFLAEILWSFIQRDYKRIAQVHFEAGYVPSSQKVEDFAQALRSIGEPIQGQSSEEISMAKLLGQLFDMTALFHMQTRPELLMLQKTMVVVEGVARDLDPSFNMWTAAEPVLKDWVKDNFGAPAKLQEAASGAASLGRVLFHLPDYVERAEKASQHLAFAAEHGLRLDEHSLKGLAGRGASPSWKTLLPLWAGAAALIFMAINSL